MIKKKRNQYILNEKRYKSKFFMFFIFFFFFQAEDGIRDADVTGVQTCALPIYDYDHRLHPEKLLSIIELSEKVLELKDQEIEVEYQGQTIEKFALEFD